MCSQCPRQFSQSKDPSVQSLLTGAVLHIPVWKQRARIGFHCGLWLILLSKNISCWEVGVRISVSVPTRSLVWFTAQLLPHLKNKWRKKVGVHISVSVTSRRNKKPKKVVELEYCHGSPSQCLFCKVHLPNEFSLSKGQTREYHAADGCAAYHTGLPFLDDGNASGTKGNVKALSHPCGHFYYAFHHTPHHEPTLIVAACVYATPYWITSFWTRDIWHSSQTLENISLRW